MAERKESTAADRKSKLALSKETLRLLDDADLAQVAGGGTVDAISVDTIGPQWRVK